MEKLIEKILMYDHNSYYVDSFHDNYTEFTPGPDGFLSAQQFYEIHDGNTSEAKSTELYEIIRLAHKIKNKK